MKKYVLYSVMSLVIAAPSMAFAEDGSASASCKFSDDPIGYVLCQLSGTTTLPFVTTTTIGQSATASSASTAVAANKQQILKEASGPAAEYLKNPSISNRDNPKFQAGIAIVQEKAPNADINALAQQIISDSVSAQ